MAQYLWKDTPTYGVCLTCGTSACSDGFVDLIAETNVLRENREISGVVDIILCARCAEQAAGIFGCLTLKESDVLRTENKDLLDGLGKMADEASSWQQRYENIVEIMSMVQLGNASPTDSSDTGASTKPSPDLRIQEGTPASIAGDGKKPSRSKR